MSPLDYLLFYWPVLMVAAFVGICGQRIKSKTEFSILAILVLFGISKLMSTDLVPRLAGVLLTDQKHLMTQILQWHWFFQCVAAIGGWFAMNRLRRKR